MKNRGFRPGGADFKSSLGSGGSAIRRRVYLKVSGDIVAERCWTVQQGRRLMASRHQRADEAVKPCSYSVSNDSGLKIHLKLAQGEENRDVARGEDAEEVGDGIKVMESMMARSESRWARGNSSAKCSLSVSAFVDTRETRQSRDVGDAPSPGISTAWVHVSLSVRVSLSLFGGGTNCRHSKYTWARKGR